MSYQRFPDDPNNPRQDPRQPPRQPYQGYGPDQAYTPPVTPSATPAEPPPQETNSVYGRGRRAWSGYYRLRGRARQNSMSWWFFKFVQGVLLGGVLLVGGGMALVAGVVVGALQCGAAIGAGLLLAGLGVMLRYVLAPVSCRWMVTVPENAYYVVEDGDGYTLEYLDSGRRTVTWRWNARVRQYATFKAVKATATVEHVLPTDGTPITIEVRVQAAFNPARADPKAYATLRQMTKPEAFQAMLVGDVGEAVRRYLHLLHPAQQPGALRAVRTLESVIGEQLKVRAKMGLFPQGEHPISVQVRVPRRFDDAFRYLHRQQSQPRYGDDQALMDIHDLANRLGIPYEEVYRLYHLWRRAPGVPRDWRSTPPPPAPGRVPSPRYPRDPGPAEWPTQVGPAAEPTLPGQVPPEPGQFDAPHTVLHDADSAPPADTVETQPSVDDSPTPPSGSTPPEGMGPPTLRATPPDPLDMRRRRSRPRPPEDEE